MVGHLPVDLAASFDSDRCLPVLLLRVDLPAIDPLCLLYGSGEIQWNAGDGMKTFVGYDDRFGMLSSLDPPEDAMGDEAPMMSFVIAAPSDTAAALLASPLYQNSRVRCWVAGLSDAEPPALLTPYMLFDGLLDRPLLEADADVRTLEFECKSEFELLFADTEGQRLADASHQAIWPGELGFIYITGIERTILWGPGERPGGGPVYANNGGSGGGGFGGGGSRNFYNTRNL